MNILITGVAGFIGAALARSSVAICIGALPVFLFQWEAMLNTIMYALLVVVISMVLGRIKNKAYG